MADFGDTTLNEILHPRYHWSTKKGFWPHSLRIACLAYGVDFFFLIALSAIKVPVLEDWLANSIWYLLLAPLLAVICYWFIFWGSRAWWKIVFSQKVNVVFAYNLVATPDLASEYDVLISQLKNQIAESNYGGILRIIKKPTDIHFENKTTAEAKTQLGLRGSTLIIWGHPQKVNGGTQLSTLFSYEFGYPNYLSEAYAKSVFGKDIQRALDGGLLGSNNFHFSIFGDTFGDYAIDTISFILGMVAASYGDTPKATLFLEEFRARYYSRDLLRRRAMGPAMGEVERTLVRMKVGLSNECYEQKQYPEMWKYLQDALGINKYDYWANIGAALGFG